MKPRSRKNRGKRLQNYVADAIKSTWPNLSDDEVESTVMGKSGVDVKLRGRIRQIFPFAIECKAHKNISIWEAIKQCELNAEVEKLIPLLVFRKDTVSDPHVCLRLQDLLTIMIGGNYE